jgi:hypothetical protein
MHPGIFQRLAAPNGASPVARNLANTGFSLIPRVTTEITAPRSTSEITRCPQMHQNPRSAPRHDLAVLHNQAAQRVYLCGTKFHQLFTHPM